jgi:hypothetical protein
MDKALSYSGAFFTSQEWAAMRTRVEDEMALYRNACMIMGTNRAHISSMSIEHNELAFPPTDLLSRKAFIRTGQSAWKKRKADRKWQQIQCDVTENGKRSATAPAQWYSSQGCHSIHGRLGLFGKV